MKLENKAAIITGGTSGIGEASARLFAAEGASVTIAARGDRGEVVAESIRESGGEAQFVPTDITRSEQIQDLFDVHLQAYGSLDVLFNNASYEGPGEMIADHSEEELDKVIATNFKSVFLACKLATPIMSEAGGGSIINTTAGSAREGCAWPRLSAYIGSKGAVIAFSRALAVEVSPLGVRVNCLNPGCVNTPMLERAAQNQPDPDAFWTSLDELHLLRRIGAPDELARAALFLASGDSSFVTGTDLLVDGGLVLS
jgi:NAD(P)-dependent dehydrogenase (short-subunit alcohol dehydrogenase family)